MLYDTLMDLFGVAADEDDRTRLPKEPAPSHDATGIRILLVEDNEMNQQVATENFSRAQEPSSRSPITAAKQSRS